MVYDRETVKRLKDLERDLLVSVSALTQYPKGKRKELLTQIRKDAADSAQSLGLDADDVRSFVNRTCAYKGEDDDDFGGMEVGVW